MSKKTTQKFSQLTILIISLLMVGFILTITSLLIFNNSETKDFILEVQKATDLQKQKPARQPHLDKVDFEDNRLTGGEVEAVKLYFKNQAEQIQPTVDFDDNLFDQPGLEFLK